MALTNLFTINTTDLTKWEKTAEHAVNREDVFEVWTDGNWVDHRVIGRTRVNGTVTLTFWKESDYANFVSLLSSERDAEGYYPITVWCANTNTTETVNAYLDIVGSTKFDVTAPIKHNTVTIQITGR